MNTLGQIKQFEDYIRQGYGYAQLCEKMNLTEQNVKDLVKEHPAFALVIKARYGIVIEPNTQSEQPKPIKSLKRKKKEEEQKGDATEEVV